ncbi:MAG: hypothetical protein IH934_02185 [Nanoarchaeota archaeon]|nr:hypothetical protein [Nanoarchaeota archaeon]
MQENQSTIKKLKIITIIVWILIFLPVVISGFIRNVIGAYSAPPIGDLIRTFFILVVLSSLISIPMLLIIYYLKRDLPKKIAVGKGLFFGGMILFFGFVSFVSIFFGPDPSGFSLIYSIVFIGIPSLIITIYGGILWLVGSRSK